jgi:hypothetical protein
MYFHIPVVLFSKLINFDLFIDLRQYAINLLSFILFSSLFLVLS